MDYNLKNNNPNRKRAFKDLLIILSIGILLFIFTVTFDVFERFAEFHQKHGVGPIDELIIVFAVLSFAFAIFSFRRWRELQEALANIKTLRGLLPICSSCKRIRDDKGYWNQVEAYIQNHSDVDFTHGICPECMKKLYGIVLEADIRSKEQGE